MMTQISQPSTFKGTALKSAQTVKAARVVSRSRHSTVTTQAGFIGSPNNLIIMGSVTAFLAAGRFGLAPTARKSATPGLKLVEDDAGAGLKKQAGVFPGDPAGFTAVDVLGHGTLGHIVGVGAILGLKAIGKL